MSEEKKVEQVVETTESTDNSAAQSLVVDPNEREARRGSRERGPRAERKDREDKSSPFLERVVTILSLIHI